MCNTQKNTSEHAPLELIRRAKNGSQSDFEALLERYTPLIESLVTRFSGDTASVQDREDFRQEAMLCFYRALMHFDPEQDRVQFGLYAKECIRNGLISLLRKLKRHENVVLLEDESEIPCEDSEKKDPMQEVVEEETYLELSRKIYDSLSAYENRIWWQYLAGRTAKEIALMLQTDEKSVQNAIYRIRRKLRTVIPYS